MDDHACYSTGVECSQKLQDDAMTCKDEPVLALNLNLWSILTLLLYNALCSTSYQSGSWISRIA
jgi:hypothetical protein